MVHGCMVYTERAETAAVSCGTSHVSAVRVYHFGGQSKTRYKKLVTHAESQASAVSLLESGEQRGIKRTTTTFPSGNDQARSWNFMVTWPLPVDFFAKKDVSIR